MYRTKPVVSPTQNNAEQTLESVGVEGQKKVQQATDSYEDRLRDLTEEIEQMDMNPHLTAPLEESVPALNVSVDWSDLGCFWPQRPAAGELKDCSHDKDSVDSKGSVDSLEFIATVLGDIPKLKMSLGISKDFFFKKEPANQNNIFHLLALRGDEPLLIWILTWALKHVSMTHLLRMNYEQNKKGFTPIQMALIYNQPSTFDIFLKMRVSLPDKLRFGSKMMSPLQRILACKTGRFKNTLAKYNQNQLIKIMFARDLVSGVERSQALVWAKGYRAGHCVPVIEDCLKRYPVIAPVVELTDTVQPVLMRSKDKIVTKQSEDSRPPKKEKYQSTLI